MSGLAALFSAETLQKFERKSKPVEFSSKRKEPVYIEKRDHPDNFNESTETVGVEGKNKAKKRKRNEVDRLFSRGDGDDRSADNEEEGAQQTREKVVRPVNHAADECTLFVGNIPTDQTIKSISALFSKFGEVESVRLRSVPTAGTAVDDGK
jgi:nucleolar protein 12